MVLCRQSVCQCGFGRSRQRVPREGRWFPERTFPFGPRMFSERIPGKARTGRSSLLIDFVVQRYALLNGMECGFLPPYLPALSFFAFLHLYFFCSTLLSCLRVHEEWLRIYNSTCMLFVPNPVLYFRFSFPCLPSLPACCPWSVLARRSCTLPVSLSHSVDSKSVLKSLSIYMSVACALYSSLI